jgi:hypothetical protein
MKNQTIWTDTDRAELRRLRMVEGVAWNVIAHRLGKGRNGCRFEAARMGIPKSRCSAGGFGVAIDTRTYAARAETWSDADRAELRRLRVDEGLPWEAIETRIGKGRHACRNEAARIGVPYLRRHDGVDNLPGGWIDGRRRGPPLKSPAHEPAWQPDSVQRPDTVQRLAIPAGHPTSWGAICGGTTLAGQPYPFPVFL